MKTRHLRVADIYVPVKRRGTADPKTVEALAEKILENGLDRPISVREDPVRNRVVLVSGLHRLEACIALGEDTIEAVIVSARQHRVSSRPSALKSSARDRMPPIPAFKRSWEAIPGAADQPTRRAHGAK